MEKVADDNYIVIRNKRYFIYAYVGEITNKENNTHTHISSSASSTGNGQLYHSVSSRNTDYVTYFIKDNEADFEKRFQFANWGDIAKVGHRLGVFWLIKEGDNSGEDYLLVVNYNTSDYSFNETALTTALFHPIFTKGRMFTITILVVWSFLGLFGILSLLTAPFSVIYTILSGNFGLLPIALGNFLISAVAVIPPFLAIRRLRRGIKAGKQAQTDLIARLRKDGCPI